MPNPYTFPILLLPTEIRHKIYNLWPLNPHPIEILSLPHIPLPSAQPQSEASQPPSPDIQNKEYEFLISSKMLSGDQIEIPTNLLRTCRSVYSEAIPIICGSNTFEFAGNACWDTFANFDATLLAQSRSCMREIELVFPGIKLDYARSAFSPTGREGLETLTLSAFAGLRELNLKLHEDVMARRRYGAFGRG